ncbi:hypothetical protein PbJCM13498_00510 [Prolixibacter bellariivorans]|uniref:Glycan metabolism protein RagB n=2 Tax=Prolixibacter bellariivorans TaxID=314319 RepID=A0A5M4AU27_9BACT|nr:hypothetical protein PbJCM13498_00510 [Prolixibacter bellariivorans]
MTSCDSFLDTKSYNQINSGDAFKTVDDVKAARNGLYYDLGSYRFCGNYVIAIGDFAGDISVADGSSGHFVNINNYAISDATPELSDVWQYGYKIVNNSTKIINGIDALLDNPETTEAQKNELNLYKAESYGLRALAYFHLVNIFGLPYGVDSNPHGGLVLMDKNAIEPEQNVSRSSVAETYSQILSDIDNSLAAYKLTPSKVNQFYFNRAAVYALKARTMLYMENYSEAITAAQESLDLRVVKEMKKADYLDMWKSLTISDEDIFTIAKTSDDNLSSNSLNTLYGSYGGHVSPGLVGDFTSTDYRLSLIDTTASSNHPMKFDGIESSAATSNIPQFRVSEMKLIIAEASAHLGLLDDARAALFFTAQRDSQITSVDDLPSTQADLLAFIAKERKRELFQEGQRYYDARRTGEKLTIANGKYTNFDVRKFVYPIPADEINAGYQCEQNENWSDNLPK